MRLIDADAIQYQLVYKEKFMQGTGTEELAAWKEDIDALPPVNLEQKWIPCSERLPEVGQDILMSVGGMYTAEGCLREDGDWAQFRWDAIQRKDMVDAWMPLPEPFKE